MEAPPLKRHNSKGYAKPGSKRAARLRAQDALKARLLARLTLKAEPRRLPLRVRLSGFKRLTVTLADKTVVITPYGARELRRRRAARKVAHESRRRNRER